METIYKNSSLLEVISQLNKVQELPLRKISEACDIHPSYYSRALKGQASFSQKQIFRMTAFYKLSGPQADFFFLLWQLLESSNKEEKLFFQQRIHEIQEEKLKVSPKISGKIMSEEEKKIHLEKYYAEALTASVHMHLTIPAYQRNPALLVDWLKITRSKLNSELSKLESLGMIKRQNEKIIQVENSVHLPEESNISFVNHINLRLKVIQELERREPKKSDYHLSVTFSADADTKFKIKQLMRESIIAIQKMVIACENPDEVHHLLMDLF